MNDFTLRQLRYVAAVARNRHFGRAAEECAVSQPALSVQVREFELSLGQPLFERHARDIRLTPFGHQIVPAVQALLRQADDLAALARAAHGALQGPVRLGIIPTIGPYLLPAIAKAVNSRYPAVELFVRETMTSALLTELRDGRLDMAIIALPVGESWLHESTLFSENFVLVRPDSDADTPPPTVAALREMKLLLLEEGHCFRDQALAYCGAGGQHPKEVLDGSNLSTLVQMVGAGLGVTLIPEMAVNIETGRAPVVVTAMPEPRPTRTIGLVWRAGSALHARYNDIATQLQDILTAKHRKPQ